MVSLLGVVRGVRDLIPGLVHIVFNRIADGLVATVLDSVDGMIDLFASLLSWPPVVASGSAQYHATGQNR